MYAIVDIETTGGYPIQHRITEIAIFHHNGHSITGSYQTLINPEREIPMFITGLTGIDNAMIKDSPKFKDVSSEIYNQLEGRIFVAHNVHFDYGFLKNEFEKVGIRWSSKKLDTVRLSRKIFPGLKSYSLGRLAESLHIKITDRHRAGGDAEATAKIFDYLLKKDKMGVIEKALSRNTPEKVLPPNLPLDEYSQLPSEVGVYYFWNDRGRVIYVGKSNNIKKRITGHFTGVSKEWSHTNIRNQIHRITYELTGNELIALLLEAKEIQRLWPPYNRAMKTKNDEWGIVSYEDQLGYRRFAVSSYKKGVDFIAKFINKSEAWSFLWAQVQTWNLCPKLSGLQIYKGECFSYLNHTCRGACAQVETPFEYNLRTLKLIEAATSKIASLVLMGKGRIAKEKSVVLIENGNYAGYGFIDESLQFNQVEKIKPHLMHREKDNFILQNIVKSFLLHPRDQQIMVLDD